MTRTSYSPNSAFGRRVSSIYFSKEGWEGGGREGIIIFD